MHVRQQGSVLVLIRTTYDAVRKRGVQSTVGRLPAYTHPDNVPAEVLSQLNEDEKAQLRDYLTARADGERQERQKTYLNTLSFSIKEAVTALEAGLQPKDAGAVWESIATLQKALKKVGHPKPRAAGDAKESV
jgi:hypothetical protein